jgi:hypothetical protein
VLALVITTNICVSRRNIGYARGEAEELEGDLKAGDPRDFLL